MFGTFERTVAWRYMLGRRQERSISIVSIFALCGIALGVAALIIVMAVRTGYREDFINKILAFDGHVYILGAHSDLTHFADYSEKISKIPNVVSVTPMVEGSTFVQSETRAAGAIIRGLYPKDLKSRILISENIRMGSLDNFGKTGNIVVGKRFAEANGIGVGDKVTLMSPRGKTSAFGTTPNIKTFNIIAIFEAGTITFDNTFLFISMEDAQRFFMLGNNISNLEIFLNNPEDVDSVHPAIDAIMGPDSITRDWKQRNARFMAALDVESNVMFIIVTLVIMIAAFNIVSAMIMLVNDKRRDIAVMRSMGATRSMISRLFFLTGASIGVFGTAIGLAVGVVFSVNVENIRHFLQKLSGKTIFDAEIYYLTKLPSKLEPLVVLLICCVALFLTFLATVYPAWRATKFDPAEALRNE